MFALEVDSSTGPTATASSRLVGACSALAANGMNASADGKRFTCYDFDATSAGTSGTFVSTTSAGTSEEVSYICVAIGLASRRGSKVLSAAYVGFRPTASPTVSTTARFFTGGETCIPSHSGEWFSS